MVVPQKVKFTLHTARQRIGAVEVNLHSTSPINEGHCSASLPGPFYLTGISFRYTMIRSLGGPLKLSVRFGGKNNIASARIRSQDRPVLSRVTVYDAEM